MNSYVRFAFSALATLATLAINTTFGATSGLAQTFAANKPESPAAHALIMAIYGAALLTIEEVR
jgi:hypothetical protein